MRIGEDSAVVSNAQKDRWVPFWAERTRSRGTKMAASPTPQASAQPGSSLFQLEKSCSLKRALRCRSEFWMFKKVKEEEDQDAQLRQQSWGNSQFRQDPARMASSRMASLSFDKLGSLFKLRLCSRWREGVEVPAQLNIVEEVLKGESQQKEEKAFPADFLDTSQIGIRYWQVTASAPSAPRFWREDMRARSWVEDQSAARCAKKQTSYEL